MNQISICNIKVSVDGVFYTSSNGIEMNFEGRGEATVRTQTDVQRHLAPRKCVSQSDRHPMLCHRIFIKITTYFLNFYL